MGEVSPVQVPAGCVRTGPTVVPPPPVPPPPVEVQAVPEKLPLTAPGVPLLPVTMPQLAAKALSAAKSFNSSEGPSPSALGPDAVGGLPDDDAPQSPPSSYVTSS